MNDDELPPYSEEYEQVVLGALLTDCRGALPICQEILNGDIGVFWNVAHKTIFQTICGLADKGDPVEVMTVFGELKSSGLLDACGGIGYIASLPEKCASPASVGYFAQSLVETAQKRRAQALGIRMASEAADPTVDAQELLTSTAKKLTELFNTARSPIRPIRELVQSAIRQMEECHQNKGRLEGIPTGFSDLDKLTQGLHDAEMIVVAGRPSTGKTSLAMNIVEHVALDHRIPVGVFSLEMSADSLVSRMICSRARVNVRNIREGFLSERDFPKLTFAAGKLISAPLFIDDSPALTVFELRARAARLANQHGIKLFVIDYLQLMRGTARKNGTRENEVSEISSGVKALAKDLKVPVIVLSQLNRDIERDKNRAPRLSDLRESGAIEQDADLVAILWREPVTGKDTDEDDSDDAISVKLSIRKQRNGPTGDVALTFLKGYTRFESAAKVTAEDVQATYPYSDS